VSAAAVVMPSCVLSQWLLRCCCSLCFSCLCHPCCLHSADCHPSQLTWWPPGSVVSLTAKIRQPQTQLSSALASANAIAPQHALQA
jgi:hypothetical protein